MALSSTSYVTTYTQETAERICAEIADGKSIGSVCKMEGMPSRRTVFNWLNQFPEFVKLYQIACEERAEGYVEEIIDIADDASHDYVSDGEGGERVDHEHIQRSRLRVDTRKWIACKLKPRKYGDKLAVGGADDLPPVAISKIERVLVDANAKNRDG